jgi:glutathione S-transferase
VKLYSYFYSSATYRVRVALNLKGIPYKVVPANTVAGHNGDQIFVPSIRKCACRFWSHRPVMF